jgi:peptidoglycan/LPS O-acetylase OafA/YrhL
LSDTYNEISQTLDERQDTQSGPAASTDSVGRCDPMTEPKPSDDGRLPGLDGLRAVSIVLVLMAHLKTLPGSPRWSLFLAIANHGQFGVEIFFVLSGFLITSLLLKEEKKAGSIDIRQFYIRRAFRILPPAFAYLLFVAMLILAGISAARWSEVVAAACFSRNLVVNGGADTGHFWSLAVEEQFYLTWPFLLVILPCRARLAPLIALLAISPLWRHEYFRLFPQTKLNVVALDYEPLMIGCLLAICRDAKGTLRFLTQAPFQSTWMFASSVLLIVILLSPIGASVTPRVQVFFQLTYDSAIALVINYLIEGKKSHVNWLLNTRPVVHLGKLSYSLYLWQQPFCFEGSALVLPAMWALFPALAGAGFSYYCIEQPALSLRRRFQKEPHGRRTFVRIPVSHRETVST